MVLQWIVLLFCLDHELYVGSSLDYKPRTTFSTIEEYRSALTLESLIIEDLKRRGLATEMSTELTSTTPMSSVCLESPRPSYAKVTKLMLELFRNLESNTGFLVPDLTRVRVRLKLLMKFSMLESEAESKSLTDKPKMMRNEIEATFSRVLAILWLEITDGTTTWNNDWCPLKKVTEYVTITDPMDIAKHLRELKPLLAQVRDIMEEFIHSITPPPHEKNVTGQKVFEKDNYSIGNITEAPLSEIDAYRSALNLNWKAAKDFRQHGLVPALPAKSVITKCSEYPKPPFGDVVKLMFELFRNIEGENSVITPELITMLMKSKLLLSDPLNDRDTDPQSYKGYPKVVLGAPQFTLSRILATVWILVSDVTLTNKRGWCPVITMNQYLSSTKPKEIENQLHVLGPLVARARFIMEEFIQTMAPLNIYQEEASAALHLENHPDEVLWNYTSSATPDTTTTRNVLIHPHFDGIYEDFSNKSSVIVHEPIVITTVLFYVYSFVIVFKFY